MADLAEFDVLVFDLDGTLFDHRRSVVGACDSWFAELDAAGLTPLGGTASWLALESSAFEDYLAGRCTFEEQRRDRIRRFLPGARSWDDARVDREFGSYLAHYRGHWSAYPDVARALEDTRMNGHRVAVLTNGDHDQQADKLERIGIARLVDDLFASSRLPAPKPARECFAAVAGALEVPPERCLMIGDDWEKDVAGARASGWQAVWIDRDGIGVETHESDPAVRTITSLTELAPDHEHVRPLARSTHRPGSPATRARR